MDHAAEDRLNHYRDVHPADALQDRQGGQHDPNRPQHPGLYVPPPPSPGLAGICAVNDNCAVDDNSNFFLSLSLLYFFLSFFLSFSLSLSPSLSLSLLSSLFLLLVSLFLSCFLSSWSWFSNTLEAILLYASRRRTFSPPLRARN